MQERVYKRKPYYHTQWTLEGSVFGAISLCFFVCLWNISACTYWISVLLLCYAEMSYWEHINLVHWISEGSTGLTYWSSQNLQEDSNLWVHMGLRNGHGYVTYLSLNQQCQGTEENSKYWPQQEKNHPPASYFLDSPRSLILPEVSITPALQHQSFSVRCVVFNDL